MLCYINKDYSMYTIFYILLSLFFMLSCSDAVADAAGSPQWTLPTREMHSLNAAMSSSAVYSRRSVAKTDSIRRQLANCDPSRRVSLLTRLSRRYLLNMADSSLNYAEEARKLAWKEADSMVRYDVSLAYADALSAAGFFTRALLLHDSLKNVKVPLSARIEYFKVGRRVYSNILSYIDSNGHQSELYQKKYEECDDSLVNLLSKDDPLRRFIIGERLVAGGKFEQAKTVLGALLDKTKKDDNLYGMAAYQMAQVYRSEGDMTAYAGSLAEAAESDIRCNIKEGIALPALAAWLYEQGNFADAFRYINFALEDAYKGNARVRMVRMARWVPAIDEAYRRQISTSRNEWFLFAAILAVLMLALGITAFFLFRQIRKSRASQRALIANSRMKDSYIGNFIGLCSTYSEKYYSLVRLVDRKISSGQASELLKSIKSGKIGNGEDEDFYKDIDSVILSLYPDFVEKINALLVPEERVRIKGGTLTPELRIYAFVRLGVSESTRIARILNYSVNTVYAYRNRMRNKAVDRENFEANVFAIGAELEL